MPETRVNGTSADAEGTDSCTLVLCRPPYAEPLLRETFSSYIPVSENPRILLANLFQSSRSTLSCVSFPRVFAFQAGMWDTQISALLNSPTVAHESGLSTAYENSSAIFRRVVWSKNSCGLALVVFQEAPEPFSTVNRTWTPFVCS